MVVDDEEARGFRTRDERASALALEVEFRRVATKHERRVQLDVTVLCQEDAAVLIR